MYRLTYLLVCGLLLTGTAMPLAAQQGQTLADIRQELTVLHVEMQKLKRELSTTGIGGTGGIGGNSALERMDGIEAELQRLTNKTEELEFRINSVVQDGTNRIGDLEFRLVELEGGDVSKLGNTTTLGGGAMPNVGSPAAATPQPVGNTGGAQVEMAMSEKDDFERAAETLAQGDFRSAEAKFKTYLEAYPGGPLESKARIGRGRALEGAGDLTEAARAYLDAFSRAPESADAPEALFRLGAALGRLQQTNEACVTLQEVATRYPTSPMASEAQATRSSLGCP